MMRICKKFLSVVLALIMSLALALTVAGCFHSKIGEDTLVIDVVFPGLSGMKPADQENNPVAEKIREETGVTIKANFTKVR